MNNFNVNDLALMVPPPECRCMYCMQNVGEIVTVTTPLLPSNCINGGVAHGIRLLDGTVRYVRPEMLQKLPAVSNEVESQEKARV